MNGEDLERTRSAREAVSGILVRSRCRVVVRRARWGRRGAGGEGVHGLGVEVFALLLIGGFGRWGDGWWGRGFGQLYGPYSGDTCCQSTERGESVECGVFFFSFFFFF